MSDDGLTGVIGARFAPGRVVMTGGVSVCLAATTSGLDWVMRCLTRHVQGDWGDIDAEDWRTNDWAVENGSRLMSQFMVPVDVEIGDALPDGRVWIVTEADRSVTTVLFPSEY